jgi:chaperonin GroES
VIPIQPRKTFDGRKSSTPGPARQTAESSSRWAKAGDKVLFGKYSGQEFKLDGQDLLHMREDDIIGIVA